MLKRASDRMAAFFYTKGAIASESDVEVYSYGLELLISSVLETLSVILLSIPFGRFWTTLLFLLAFCPLRSFAGGYHAKTHAGCFMTLLVVYAVFLALSFFPRQSVMEIFSLAAVAVSVIFVVLFAPVADPNKPLSPPEIKKCRTVSLTMVSCEAFLVFLLICLHVEKLFVFSISYGLLTAALSLVAVKIKTIKDE